MNGGSDADPASGEVRAFADAQETETRAARRGAIEPLATVRDMQTDVPRRHDEAHDRGRAAAVFDDVLQCLLRDAEQAERRRRR